MIVVNGDPVPKARARITRSGHAYTPQKTKGFESLVKFYASLAFKRGEVWDGEVGLDVKFFVRIPKSYQRAKHCLCASGFIRPTSKPDLDNLVKAVQDALNGIAYRDDSQIVTLSAQKLYSDKPRTEIIVTHISGGEQE